MNCDTPQVLVCKTPEELGRRVAEDVAQHVRSASAQGKRCVLGLATGSTPLPVYAALREIFLQDASFDLSNVTTFNLDEYVGLATDHPESYHSFMYRNLFDGLLFDECSNLRGIRRERIHLPTGGRLQYFGDLSADDRSALDEQSSAHAAECPLDEHTRRAVLQSRCENYEKSIASAGGITLQLLGIGHNGHIGFNEPLSSFSGPTKFTILTEETRSANARFFDNDLSLVPTHAITMGIGTILNAKRILLLATGVGKSAIIARTLREEITEAVPATAIRKHRYATVYLDEAAAEKLSGVASQSLSS